MTSGRAGWVACAVGAVGLAFTASSVLAAPADTLLEDETNFTETWFFEGTGSEEGTPISGEVYWNIVEEGTTAYFIWSIANTSIDNSEITGFAWDYPAGVTGDKDDYGSSLGWFYGDGFLPDGEGEFDACVWPATNCQAASGDGISSGEAWNWFYIALETDTAFGELSGLFADTRACLRFGTVGAGGEDSGVACRVDARVPEPAALGLFGAGLLLMAFMTRRRRQV